MKKSSHPNTGMSPEYAEFDGSPVTKVFESGSHDWFYSDAYRTIANIAMDHLWFDKDPWQVQIAEKFQKFYCEDQKDHWDGVFLTDGTRLEEIALQPVAIIAVNAESALAADGTYAIQSEDKFTNTPNTTCDNHNNDKY